MAVHFYRDHIHPHLGDAQGDPPPIRKTRQQIIPPAEGKVLEIGAGSGVNFVHYDSARVGRLYALEPNSGMIRLAHEQQRRTRLIIEFLDLPGVRMPLEDKTVDTVVSTFTPGTIAALAGAVRGIARIVKPGGKLIFFELGLSPDPNVQSWQRQLEPIFRWLLRGLYLRRDIPSLIREGGFQINKLEKGYLAEFPRSLSYCWWGIAGLQRE